MKKAASSLGGILDQIAGNTDTQESGNTGPGQHEGAKTSPKPTLAGAGKRKLTLELDAAFARELKVECAREGITMREYVIRAIEAYRNGRGDR